MGSKGSNTSTTVNTPPPEMLAKYLSVVNRAEGVANTPYMPYGGDQVAGFTPRQEQAFGTIDSAVGMAQPYISDAKGYAQQGATPISPMAYSWDAMQPFMNPHQQGVIDATMANIREDNAIDDQRLIGNAIAQGAWGGDRVGVARAELARKQDLASNKTLADMNYQNFLQAMQQFNTQQGVGLAADQANAQRYLQASGAMSGLGQLAQGSTLQGAGAQLGVGNLEQQLAQSQLNIPYQQFLEERAWPFQTTQFLSGVTTGLGSQMGGTASTTTPGPSLLSQIGGLGMAGVGLAGLLMSDARAKDDIVPVGKTFDGLPIYRFHYEGDPKTQIGLMAQDVEQRDPGAVHDIGGLKYLDYDRATAPSARAHMMNGGVPYIPNIQNTMGKGPPQAPPPYQDKSVEQLAQQAMSVASMLKGAMGKGNASGGMGAMPVGNPSTDMGFGPLYADGGAVLDMASGPDGAFVPQGFAEGGPALVTSYGRYIPQVPGIPTVSTGNPAGWSSFGAQLLGITDAQFNAYRDAVVAIEGADYGQMGGANNHYAGRYQMGSAARSDAARFLGEPTPSLSDFLSNPAMQDRYFAAYTAFNDRVLRNVNPDYRTMSPQERLGALGYAWNQGAGGANEYLRTGVSGQDAFGTEGSAYQTAVTNNLNQLRPGQGVDVSGTQFLGEFEQARSLLGPGTGAFPVSFGDMGGYSPSQVAPFQPDMGGYATSQVPRFHAGASLDALPKPTLSGSMFSPASFESLRPFGSPVTPGSFTGLGDLGGYSPDQARFASPNFATDMGGYSTAQMLGTTPPSFLSGSGGSFSPSFSGFGDMGGYSSAQSSFFGATDMGGYSPSQSFTDFGSTDMGGYSSAQIPFTSSFSTSYDDEGYSDYADYGDFDSSFGDDFGEPGSGDNVDMVRFDGVGGATEYSDITSTTQVEGSSDSGGSGGGRGRSSGNGAQSVSVQSPRDINNHTFTPGRFTATAFPGDGQWIAGDFRPFYLPDPSSDGSRGAPAGWRYNDTPVGNPLIGLGGWGSPGGGVPRGPRNIGELNAMVAANSYRPSPQAQAMGFAGQGLGAGVMWGQQQHQATLAPIPLDPMPIDPGWQTRHMLAGGSDAMMTALPGETPVSDAKTTAGPELDWMTRHALAGGSDVKSTAAPMLPAPVAADTSASSLSVYDPAAALRTQPVVPIDPRFARYGGAVHRLDGGYVPGVGAPFLPNDDDLIPEANDGYMVGQNTPFTPGVGGTYTAPGFEFGGDQQKGGTGDYYHGITKPPAGYNMNEGAGRAPFAIPTGPDVPPNMAQAPTPTLMGDAPSALNPTGGVASAYAPEDAPTDISAQRRAPEQGGDEEARRRNLWMSLMASGFGMMASKSPHALSALGEGGLMGMRQYAVGEKGIRDDRRTRVQEAREGRQERRADHQMRIGLETLRQRQIEAQQRAQDREEDRSLRREEYGTRREDRAEQRRLREEENKRRDEDRDETRTFRKEDAAERRRIREEDAKRRSEDRQDALETRRTGAAASSSTERIAEGIRQQEKAAGREITYEESINRARKAPRDRQDELARARLAQDGAKGDPDFQVDPVKTLDKWRKMYGLTPATSGDDAPAPADKGKKDAPKPNQKYREGQRARNPQTGAVLEFRDGKWVPVQ